MSRCLAYATSSLLAEGGRGIRRGRPTRLRVQVERALGTAISHWHSYGSGRWIQRCNGTALGTARLARCQVLGRAEIELGYALLPGA
jgi:hypothetical protein